MPTKITVNGIDYESVDAMPPDVRKVYEDTMAKFASLGPAQGDKPSEVVYEGHAGPVHYTTAVRKQIVVNGKSYESEESMPPDVRQAYQLGMRTLSADPTLKKNEIKMSIQVTGPHFQFTKDLGGHAQPSNLSPAELEAQAQAGSPMPTPIEPASAPAGLRILVFVAACVALSMAVWYLARLH